jgi:hypothetical protein
VLERLPGIRFLAQSIFVSAAAAPLTCNQTSDTPKEQNCCCPENR